MEQHQEQTLTHEKSKYVQNCLGSFVRMFYFIVSVLRALFFEKYITQVE